MNYLFISFHKRNSLVTAIFMLCISSLFSETWDNWRGPNYNGSNESGAALPVDFDQTKGVKWKTNLPGVSAATPIVFKGRVFVPSVSVSGKKGQGELLAMCFDSSTGKLLWSKKAGSGYRPGQSDGFDYMLHDRSNYASPSPVVGEDGVFFF